MQFTTITTVLVAIFIAATKAAPTPAIDARAPAYATLRFTNEQAGYGGSAQIELNNTPYSVSYLYTTTNLNKGGVFQATAAELTGDLSHNIQCIVESSSGSYIGRLTSRKTYTKLGWTSPLVDLTTAQITCIECEACQAW